MHIYTYFTNKRVLEMRAPLAARREPAGVSRTGSQT